MNKVQQYPYFLDPPPEFRRQNQALFQVLPVPFEATVTYGGGTADGPLAILRASEQVEYFNGIDEPYRRGIYTHPPLQILPPDPAALIEEVKKRTLEILAQKAIPVILGGEHTVSVGVFQALKKSQTAPFGIVQFDAHADLRDS